MGRTGRVTGWGPGQIEPLPGFTTPTFARSTASTPLRSPLDHWVDERLAWHRLWPAKSACNSSKAVFWRTRGGEGLEKRLRGPANGQGCESSQKKTNRKRGSEESSGAREGGAGGQAARGRGGRGGGRGGSGNAGRAAEGSGQRGPPWQAGRGLRLRRAH